MRALRIPGKLILIVLAAKLFILFFVIATFRIFPVQDFEKYKKDNFIYPESAQWSWQEAFKTWDASHYLYIADHGYTPARLSNAFLPLYPFITSIVSRVCHAPSLITALLTSNIFSLAAFIALFYFVQGIFDAETAYRTILYTALFPTSFFYNCIYSESLFLFLIVLTFLFLYKENYLGVALCSLLAPLTKGIGVFLIFPLIIHVFDKNARGSGTSEGKSRMNALIWLFPLIGFLISLVVMKVYTGNWFETFHAQNHFIAQPDIFRFLNLPGWFIDNFVGVHLTWSSPFYTLYDRLLFLMYVYFLWRIFKMQDKTLFAFALFFGIVPAITTSLMSFSRYLIVLFPMFIQLATEHEFNHRRNWLLMFICQVLLAWVHSRGGWVA